MQETKKFVFSERWQLIKQDAKKVGVGFMIAALGGLATWLETDLTGLIDFSHFGQYQMLAMAAIYAINSGVINAIRKFIGTDTYVTN